MIKRYNIDFEYGHDYDYEEGQYIKYEDYQEREQKTTELIEAVISICESPEFSTELFLTDMYRIAKELKGDTND